MFFYRETQLQNACCSTEEQSLILQVLLQTDKASAFSMHAALQIDTASGCLLLYREIACSSADKHSFSMHAALQTDKASACMFLYRETKPDPACYLHRYDRECLQIASTLFCSSTRQADHNIHMLLCSSRDGQNGCVI